MSKGLYDVFCALKRYFQFRVRFYRMCLADRKNLFQYMGGYCRSGESFANAKLTFLCHRIEKGLAMPEFRAGFGVGLLTDTLNSVEQYEMDGYDRNSVAYKHCLSVIREYIFVHSQIGYSFEKVFLNKLTEFETCHPGEKSSQPVYDADKLWSKRHEEFPVFAASRHTVRHYDGCVSDEQVTASVRLAHETAPQACNRSFVRVHYFKGEVVQRLLSLQNGNSGFGHLCKQLLVVTVDMGSVLFDDEWYDMRTNAGIYVMNLSYALHYHRVAHCILNCWRHAENDELRYKISGIPRNEVPVVYVSCGAVPKEFKVAESPRTPVEKIFTVH